MDYDRPMSVEALAGELAAGHVSPSIAASTPPLTDAAATSDYLAGVSRYQQARLNFCEVKPDAPAA